MYVRTRNGLVIFFLNVWIRWQIHVIIFSSGNILQFKEDTINGATQHFTKNTSWRRSQFEDQVYKKGLQGWKGVKATRYLPDTRV